MEAFNKGSYKYKIDPFRHILTNQNIVLRHASALEQLEMFVGYINDSEIDVYSLEPINNNNINYRIVENFNDIEIVRIDNIYCTTFNQTINDMISDPNSDLEALLQALSDYYHANNHSFDGLKINQKNKKGFEEIRDWAIDYYNGG